jgi:hypothetical protein
MLAYNIIKGWSTAVLKGTSSSVANSYTDLYHHNQNNNRLIIKTNHHRSQNNVHIIKLFSGEASEAE